MRKPIIVGAIAALVVAACGAGSDKGAAPSSRNFRVGGFESIEVAGPYRVEVRTGAEPSVSATGSERMLEQLVVEVRDGRLMIHSTPNKRLFDFGRKQDEVHVTVTVPQLRAAEITGSGDIRIGRISGDEFAAAIAGSGEIAVEQADVKRLSLAVTGSGTALVSGGTADHLAAAIAGSGEIESRGLVAQRAEISISGSGHIAAQARITAAIEVMGSGEVDLTGGAKCTISKSGSADIRCS